MEQIFPERVPDLLIELKPDMPALWGKMDAQEMVEHLANATRMSFEDEHTKIYTPEEKLDRAKRSLMSERPLPRLYKAPFLPDDPIAKVFHDLEQAKAALLGSIDDFFSFYTEKDDTFTMPHPVFGHLNGKEWTRFHNKHFNHHFGQFGLIEVEER